jgi:bifunctional non-homologous end joining protein LigD
LLQQLKKGSLKFKMNGKKLKGEFALVKLKNAENNAWLLIKHRDKYAKETDVTKKDKSVVSGKTIKTIEKTSKNIWGSSPKKKSSSKKTRKARVEKKKTRTEGKKAPFPKTVRPMLATLVDQPFDEPGWLYEIKWDGYRAVAMINKGKVDLLSRNNKSFNEKFYPVVDALKKWHINAVIDGEVVVLNDKGISNFGSLQNWRSEADGSLFYYVFDVLWLNGYDLKSLPLTRRREILKDILPNEDIIRFSENF